MKIKKVKFDSKEREKNNQSHSYNRHKVSYVVKIIIWSVLVLICLVALIYVLGSPIIIAQKNLDYHPLFTYFQHEFKLNKIDPNHFTRQLFSLKNLSKKSNRGKKRKNQFQKQNIINFVYENATQSHHLDNWIFLGEYISFLVNREHKVIRKTIKTHKFASFYSQPKFHTKIPKFSESFVKILETQSVFIEDLRQKKLIEKVKDEINDFLTWLIDIISNTNKVKSVKNNEESRVWILWLLHSEVQDLKELRKQLNMLQFRYAKDKFVVLSFYPIFKQQDKRVINYGHYTQYSFTNLLKSYLNLSKIQSKLISDHFEFSLLKLSYHVFNEESFSLYHLVGGRLGYRDLQKIPSWIVEKVDKFCKGEKVKVQKMKQEEVKKQFYRIGIYKFGADIMWRNQQARNNYEFQTGKLCRKIPIFHHDYFSMFNIFKKVSFGFRSKTRQ